ncbi:MAG: ketosteroid isomerase-like protein [Nitrospinales bacterium]|jgi:ketosteroid isomerase-like protein
MTNDKEIKQDVLESSQKWIEAFNKGDADTCIAGYQADAVINAKPLGTFTGTDEIDAFWRPFMAAGAGALEYKDVQLEVVDASTVLLSASWTMNVGRGIITLEKWVLQIDDNWLLAQDDFEIKENFQLK